MKYFMFFLALTVTANSFAKNRAHKKEVKKLFVCAREALETHRATTADLMTIHKLLINAAHEELVEEKLVECEELLETLPRNRTRTTEELVNDNEILFKNENVQLGTYQAVRTILENRYMSCSTKGVDAELVLGIGGGVGASAGRCLTDDGRAYIVIGLNYEIGFGLFVGVTTGDKDEDKVKTDGKHKPHDAASMGLLLAYRVSIDESQKGTGLGVGFAWLPIQHTHYLPIIKRFNDFSKIKETILTNRVW